ncbi:PLD nuclease N-terminal domain-containing protein [Niallia sp. 03133]|uniref:PLD nuclease N-terminal domain-containing protein n=1 Tax=Niallia sp. 03133 TaxID=3458060 RepID=UPI0040446968
MKLHYGLDDLKNFDFMTFIPMLAPFIIVGTILTVTALIDLYKNRKMRMNIFMWACIIIFIQTIGPILYFVLGRKESERV